MPYTLLQALGYVAQHGPLQWERIFSPPNSPRYPIRIRISRTKNTASSYIDKSCRLRLTRRDGIAKRSMLVFKTVRGKGVGCGDACLRLKGHGGVRGCAVQAQERVGGDFAEKRDIVGCKVCGKFVEMWVDDLEEAVPELKGEEEREVGGSDSGYSSMCEN